MLDQAIIACGDRVTLLSAIGINPPLGQALSEAAAHFLFCLGAGFARAYRTIMRRHLRRDIIRDAEYQHTEIHHQGAERLAGMFTAPSKKSRNRSCRGFPARYRRQDCSTISSSAMKYRRDWWGSRAPNHPSTASHQWLPNQPPEAGSRYPPSALRLRRQVFPF